MSKAQKIADILSALYPHPPSALQHDSTFQLLIAVMLLAQSTDKKVNEITPMLFEKYPTAEQMQHAIPEDVLSYIRSIGLAPTKSRNIVNTSKMICQAYHGRVPDDKNELTKLPGVGAKTANVVLSQGFGKCSFAVDTHIYRLARRWGLSDVNSSLDQVEQDLKDLYPENTWRDLHLQFIYFGREHCPAKKHDINTCPVCSWAGCRV